MDSKRWWVAVPLTLGLVVAACGSDDGAEATEAPATPAAATAAPATEAPATDAPATEAPAAATDAPAPGGAVGAAGVMVLGDEEIGLDRALCFFQEQPRAGLGGVFTHTLQANATNAAGAPLILDISRARAEDGTVSDDVTVDIGDPREDDFVGLRGGGPEGIVTFGEASASGTDISVTDFETDPVNLSFEVTCG